MISTDDQLKRKILIFLGLFGVFVIVIPWHCTAVCFDQWHNGCLYVGCMWFI